jgi:ribosomal protein S18 acetylase RimI-like enzyme
VTPTPRAALASDAAAIADLVRRAFAAQARPTVPPSSALKETTATITAHLAHGGGAVVEFEGRLVGAVLWEDGAGGLYLSRLSVHPEHRRQGIARALVDEAEREARRRGLTWMHLGVRLELEDNRQLFRSCGFEETTLRRHEGFDEPTWVRMERRLD